MSIKKAARAIPFRKRLLFVFFDMKIILKNISKNFGNAKAVNDFSCDLPDGHLICLLGPSGCGKSTILNMLCGILSPTQGKIFFDDNDVTSVPPDKRNIGMVFQNYALYPHLTVLENIAFPLEIKKIPKKERVQEAEKIASLVKVDQLLKRYPAELSGGQQQRVAIARALIKKPKILLMDEPLSNLDARLRLEMREEIRRIQQETKITTVFVTHDQEEAMSISDSIILMKNGFLIQQGLSQELYNNPNCSFTAEFLGNPPINKIKNSKDFLDFSLKNGIFPSEYKSLSEKNVFFEIRPECFKFSKNQNSIKCKILRISQMGKEEIVYFDFFNQEVCAVLQNEDDFSAGQEVFVDFKKKGLFVFDAKTEKRVAVK